MIKKTTLNILQDFKINNPCHESWDKMDGNERSKYCLKCCHSVNNLSAMSRAKAQKLLANADGKRLCVRYELDSFGAIKFKKSNAIFNAFYQSCLLLIGLCFGFSNPLIAEENFPTPVPTQTSSATLLGKIAPRCNSNNEECIDDKDSTPPVNIRMGEIAPVSK